MANTLQSKMGEPLETIVKSIESIEGSEAISNIQNGDSLRDQMKYTKIQALLVLFHLKDLQDWDALKQGKLKTV